MVTRTSVRERLLDAADALLFAEGAVAVPVDVIVKQAGASPASLYAQFGNKNGLIAAALERRFTEWTHSWDEALAAAHTAEDRALSVFEALRIYQSEHLTERWCAFSGIAASTPNPSDDVASILEKETTLLRTRFLELSQAITEKHANELASILMMTYNGTLTMMLREPWQDAVTEGEQVARRAIRALLADSQQS